MSTREEYSVKAIKSFHGHDGYGWECKLYDPANKFVAFVVEDGWGGGLQFHWNDEELARVETTFTNTMGTEVVTKQTPAQSALTKFCMESPKWKCNDKMVHTCPDVLMSDLVENALTMKDVKKMLKKVAIFDDGKVYTYNVAPSHSNIRTVIAKKYPNAIVLNDVSISEAVAIYKGAGA
jgi:hypothetical protein